MVSIGKIYKQTRRKRRGAAIETKPGGSGGKTQVISCSFEEGLRRFSSQLQFSYSWGVLSFSNSISNADKGRGFDGVERIEKKMGRIPTPLSSTSRIT